MKHKIPPFEKPESITHMAHQVRILGLSTLGRLILHTANAAQNHSRLTDSEKELAAASETIDSFEEMLAAWRDLIEKESAHGSASDN